MLPEAGVAGFAHGRGISDAVQARLNLVPQILINYPKVRDIFDYPLILRIWPGQSIARYRVFYIALLIPHQSSHIEIVTKNARAPGVMATDGGIAPGSASWTRNILSVQGSRYSARGMTLGEHFKDPYYDNGFSSIDGPVAAYRVAIGIDLFDDVIAVGISPC